MALIFRKLQKQKEKACVQKNYDRARTPCRTTQKKPAKSAGKERRCFDAGYSIPKNSYCLFQSSGKAFDILARERLAGAVPFRNI